MVPSAKSGWRGHRSTHSTPVSYTHLDVYKRQTLHLRGASGNNLKNVDLDIASGLFTCITGVSGSGKSTLINDTLYTPVSYTHLDVYKRQVRTVRAMA